MLEMVLLAYVIGWIQNLLHYDFDEVNDLKIRVWISVAVSSFVYAAVGHFAGWFDGNIGVCIGFGFYLHICLSPNYAAMTNNVSPSLTKEPSLNKTSSK